MTLTPSEALVERLCSRSFLSLWSYANPRARAGKELCDVLVVCDPDVIIFSVKEIALGDGDYGIASERWQKKAIMKSVDQLYGAERTLRTASRVERRDGAPGLPLPALASRRVYRVAVALGGEGKVWLPFGDFGKGYVHVFDEIALDLIMGELDTVVDFAAYLRAKETLAKDGRYPVLQGGEEDLLAVYLHQGRCFPDADILIIQPNTWKDLVAKSEWVGRKAADQESYVWDRLVETLAELTGVVGALGAQGLSEREAVLRIMAREDRFARRVLAKSFNEFMAAAARQLTRARIACSPSRVVYVFLAAGRDEDRESRIQELSLRCFVARGLHPEAVSVVGLATERYQPGSGFSLDVVRISIDEWTEEHARHMRGIQTDLGYFAKPVYSTSSEDEYPPG